MQTYGDTKEKGLRLYITAGGAVTFFVRKRISGRDERVILGAFPEMTVEQARAAALQTRAAIAGCANPNLEKTKLRQEITFEELFREYMERYSKPHKRSWQFDEREVNKYLSHWFSRKISSISKQEVAKLRKELATRTTPWTVEELKHTGPQQPLENRSAWKLTASHNDKELAKAIDGNPETRWDTHTTQKPGMWLQIELPQPTNIAGFELDTANSRNDWPRGWKIEVSQDGQTWDKPVLEGQSEKTSVTEFMLPKATSAKFIRITDTGSSKGNFWSIHELDVLEMVK